MKLLRECEEPYLGKMYYWNLIIRPIRAVFVEATKLAVKLLGESRVNAEIYEVM